MYKLPRVLEGETINCVITEDGMMSIPFDPANKEYQEYLKWLAAGNTPREADNGTN
jgi:hypothetical protein